MREEIPLKEIIQQIESPSPPACFLFIANEPFLAENCIVKIKEKYISKDLEEFNFHQLRGWETNYADICQKCLTHPLMSQHRMVVVKEAERIELSDIQILKDYLNNPSPSTILIFLYGSPSLKAPPSVLKKHGKIYYFNMLSEKSLAEWITAQLGQKGYAIEYDAIQFLLDQTGADMTKINNELKKLELTGSDKKNIRLEDVETLISRSQRHSAFHLADAIGKKETHKAIKLLNRLIEDGEEPLKILGALAFHFRQLIKLKNLFIQKLPDTMIMNELKINRFNYIKLKEQSELFSLSELEQTFQSFFQTDLLLKSSQVKAYIYMEQLILQLITRDTLGRKSERLSG